MARRVLVVGQETLGDWTFRAGGRYPWPHQPLNSLLDFLGHQDLIPAMIDVYTSEVHQRRFWCDPVGELRVQGGTPFWNAVGHLASVPGSAMLWTNLVRCALGQGSAIAAVERGTLTHHDLNTILQFQHGLLAREIEILSPTAVVFLTGPKYDFALANDFPESDILPCVEGYADRIVARIVAPGLPSPSFRVYHPGYLQRSGLWQLLDEIRVLT